VIAYFDTSAFVKILVEEPGSDRALGVWATAGTVVASALLYPETRAAIARGRRGDRLTRRAAKAAVSLLHDLVGHVALVAPTEELLWRAGDIAERHGLRGYDAVHLASAVDAGRGATMVTADAELAAAAVAEGLAVVVPA
jgi:predicted nucleic acid-binding protein